LVRLMPLVALKLILPNSASGVSLDATPSPHKHYQRRDTTKITVATISHGTITQLTIDLDLRL
jgi:hypothetical protein